MFRFLMFVCLVVVGICLTAEHAAAQCAPCGTAAPPSMVFQPITQYQPLAYQGSSYQQKLYPTPLRSLVFGSGTINHQYSAVSGVGNQTPVLSQPTGLSLSQSVRGPVAGPLRATPGAPVVTAPQQQPQVLTPRIIIEFIR